MIAKMASDERHNIPVINFKECGLHVPIEDLDFNTNAVKQLARDIFHACSTIGCFYLQNHSIQLTDIQDARTKVDEFFNLPSHSKSHYSRTISNQGWLDMESGRKRQGEVCRESFNVIPGLCHPQKLPDKLVSDFSKETLNLFTKCDVLAHRVVQILTLALDLQVLDVFKEKDKAAASETTNRSTLKFLRYHPVTDVQPGQVRLGEHTDFSFITLLFQDDVGGLEVQTQDGSWVPARPIPDTVVVHLGDAIQRWTADRMRATPHRVSIPDDVGCRGKERRSIAFFLHPNDDWLLTTIGGSEKYTPLLYKDYLDSKHKANATPACECVSAETYVHTQMV